MKKHLIAGLPAALLTGALCMPLSVNACAPYFQPSYLETQDPYVIEYYEEAAIRRLIKNCNDIIPASSKLPVGINSRKAAKQDFADAVNRRMTKLSDAEKKELIDEFNDFFDNSWVRCKSKYAYERVLHHNFPEMPEELVEFELYFQGVSEMTEEYRLFPEAWKKLLELPAEKRHYRTTWVYFMLGNYLHDPQYYRLCRQAVREGFADTAGLGRASYKNEITNSKATSTEKIRLALEAQKSDPELQLVRDAFIEILGDDDYHKVMQDPLAREVLALMDGESTRFIRYSSHLTFRNGDIVAFKFFEQGDYITAIDWIKRLEKPTLLSIYIEAKIARMNGNMPLAIKKLRTWLEMAKAIDPKDRSDIDAIRRYDKEGDFCENIENEVYGLMGFTLVMRRDFMEAAEFFYRAGQDESDLSFIAEHFFTLDQLITFAEKIRPDAAKKATPDYRQPWIARSILHLTARRAFREGRMDIARKYMPQEYLPDLDAYEKFMQTAQDSRLSGNERAIALYNAAKIMRYRGMELCGTEGEPDNYRYRGGFAMEITEQGKCMICEYDPHLGAWNFCQKHDKAADFILPGLNAAPDYFTVPLYRRFHYRYTAAGMALQAGSLAEDAELRALIYLFGGECLRIRSPQEADVLYKKLVNECRQTQLGKLADQNRWFPVDKVPLRRQIKTIEPLKDLNEVKKLMQEAFPNASAVKKP
ncbi:MAG: hypothetical protein E7047_10560 [Lentisphaerae bacterium]|nr:hypothetical protein [Lentisphaerota bacterium]